MLLCSCGVPATVELVVHHVRGPGRHPRCDEHADALARRLPVLAPGVPVTRESIPRTTEAAA